MANRVATLVRNANIEGIGWRRGNLVKSRNGRFKPGFMMYNGRECAAPNGSYQIRHYGTDGKAVYTSVGDDLDKAEAALNRLLDTMQLNVLNTKLGVKLPEPEKAKKTLAQYKETFLVKYAVDEKEK
ncbi:MAG TPA: hypothetical protein VMR02_15150 [Terracidiphilus sp.]|nr:hypothetical protein [Terracidiphilus sp.]